MADNPADNIQEKMRQLRDHYLSRLIFWTSDLEAYRPQRDHWDQDKAAALRSLAHNLSGSGGTYGFHDISSTARALETALVTQIATQGAPFLPFQELEALISACTNALSTTTPEARKSSEDTVSRTDNGHDLPLLLIVDDDPNIQDMIEKLITGARVISADNAEDALRLIQERQPSLILLDDKMATGISGLDMLEKMRASPQDKHIPVVMLTASDQPQQVMRGLAHGAADYITKPFDPAILVSKIQERLRKSQMSVLIADDDEPVRELLAYKFRAAGCTVTLANDGAEALTLMQAHPPSLALLDRMMPGQDGLFVLQKMRETPALQSVPVIFLTAKHSDADIVEGLNHGAADYIVKPFNPEEVVVRCMRLLQQKK